MKNVDIIIFLFGILWVQVVVKILKRVIKQKRPSQKGKTDYGMPSTRAATVTFMVTYLLLICDNLSNITKIFALIFVFLSCFMKYYLKEHTLEQITIGGLIGVIAGVMLNKIRNTI